MRSCYPNVTIGSRVLATIPSERECRLRRQSEHPFTTRLRRWSPSS
ncbi:hypothetical protein HMPREF9056_03066 [Actinomyces sp. oral taxon 170 str. F0386]|nr:hypothetical protein HMPREF9056_03066 [Actinomyces sp. oral taxon 170 str. F0386]